MWSKLLILGLTAVFLIAVGNPVMSHDGRISNIIDEPGEADEHPWGGENQMTDGPQLVSTSIEDPFVDAGKFYFIRITVKGFWVSIRGIFWDTQEDGKPRASATLLPTDNNTTQPGARN